MRKSGLAVGQVGTKSFFQENNPDAPGTLTLFGAILGIISTILGGGMVSIPFAFYSQGIVIGACFSIFAAV
jgi:amino acid permease